jgi:hypothetical protein
MKRLNQSGVAHVIILLAVVIVAVVGFASWRVLDNDDSKSSNTAQTAANAQQEQANKLENPGDVKKASAELDAEDVDKSLDSSQLDADLNDLL